MTPHHIGSVIVLACSALLSGAALADNAAPAPGAGYKLDNGLGTLPHYRDWSDKSGRGVLPHHAVRVPGESLDSGLGELPHFSKWAANWRDGASGTVRVALNSKR